MKITLLSILMCLTAFVYSQAQTIYDFKVTTIEGETLDLSKFKGKKVMIVNTASKCGFTPQYEQLQALYEKYKNDDFVILGFPSNQFMKQEPGTDEEIAAFCQKNYGVTFPMMSKVKVKGENQIPLYKFLTEKSQNGVMDSKVKWNFQKYLINEEGELVAVYYSKTAPNASVIIEWIEGKR